MQRGTKAVPARAKNHCYCRRRARPAPGRCSKKRTRKVALLGVIALIPGPSCILSDSDAGDHVDNRSLRRKTSRVPPLHRGKIQSDAGAFLTGEASRQRLITKVTTLR